MTISRRARLRSPAVADRVRAVPSDTQRRRRDIVLAGPVAQRLARFSPPPKRLNRHTQVLLKANRVHHVPPIHAEAVSRLIVGRPHRMTKSAAMDARLVAAS